MAKSSNIDTGEFNAVSTESPDSTPASSTTGNDNGANNRRAGKRTRKSAPIQQGETNAETTTLEIENDTISPEKKRRTKRSSIPAKRQASAASSAGIMLDMLSGLGESVIGPAGAIEITERALIEDPLARVIARSDPAKMGEFLNLLDPILIGMGLVMYMARVNKVINPPKPKIERSLNQSLTPKPGQEPDVLPVLRQNLAPIGQV